ncbi:DUF4309 domain-containing protein [Kurthia sibirica]|uniref:DUF4309 domain-containing protein n=1 Tax=Kurthia sibirica TaxID=202750 RepID=A0A2U3AKD2_9BACL|nr:DUF4309 domain-containing protein [Kurthia sibirica]PWI24973.1 hypothetical protein DEX24_10385 [Kurthia sibirica]GEK33121.1 hypothetical protein KSI01_06540 [Kurthia sibirica]
MKKVIILFVFMMSFGGIVTLESQAASTNTYAIKELKKIKALAKEGKTLNSGSLKLNDPYEKFFKKFGKPIYTFTPQGAAFRDHFTNGIQIYTNGKYKNWDVTRIKKDPVYSITMNYLIDYKHIKKVFGTKKSLSYASGEYFITYKVGKNTVSFSIGSPHAYDLPNLKLYNNTLFYEYGVSKGW